MPCNIYVGDEGTVFTVTIVDCETGAIVDLLANGVTTKEIIFKKPDNTVVTKTATFLTDGSDGIITYTSIAGDLDQFGESWSIQGYVEGPSFKNNSTIENFTVEENLKP